MDSKRINATEGKLKIIMDNIVNSKIDNHNFEKVIDDKIENSKIRTGIITKYYPYLDKAEVKLDKSKKKVLCKILHRYGGDMIDFYTPLSSEKIFCQNLKEPAIIPKAYNHVCVLNIHDADSEEHLILGYYMNEEVVGMNPAKPGNIKLTSITEPNLYWIKFGRDGLDLRLPNVPTKEVGVFKDAMQPLEYYTKEEVDEKINSVNTDNDFDINDKISYVDLLKLIESYKQESEDRYYLFRGDCWVIDNNYESSASITSSSKTDMKVTGTFRTENDKVKLYWYSKDVITHPYISYGERCDYSNVVLEFDYVMEGCKDFSYDDSTSNPLVIDIATNHGEIYYVTMNRFITTDDETDVNHFCLDFEELIAKKNEKYVDSKGDIQVLDKDTKLSVNDIKYISFTIIPEDYTGDNGSEYTIMNNTDFDCEISNIRVNNGDICGEHVAFEPHKYRVCEKYDDVHDLNPYRIAREMRKLGYFKSVDLSIGTSYFYEKSGNVGDTIPIEDTFNYDRSEKMVLNKNVSLNKAFSTWLDCYVKSLKENDVENLIISVSMSNLQCPVDWRQKQFGEVNSGDLSGYAVTDSTPSTFYYSPCNEEVIRYMQKVSMDCLDIVVENDMPPILQVSEAVWGWDKESQQSPCFYDNATVSKYKNEYNKELPDYTNLSSEYDKKVTSWLNQQLVNYCEGLRDVVKSSRYENGEYMILFNLPYVLDEEYTPQLMRDVNYIKKMYNPVKLDILQLEDYDWIINNSEEVEERNKEYHKQVYTISDELGFLVSNVHYYTGFIEYSTNTVELWELIKESMNNAFDKGFGEVYVFTGTQIRKDNKIIGYDKYELVQQILM